MIVAVKDSACDLSRCPPSCGCTLVPSRTYSRLGVNDAVLMPALLYIGEVPGSIACRSDRRVFAAYGELHYQESCRPFSSAGGFDTYPRCRSGAGSPKNFS